MLYTEIKLKVASLGTRSILKPDRYDKFDFNFRKEKLDYFPQVCYVYQIKSDLKDKKILEINVEVNHYN